MKKTLLSIMCLSTIVLASCASNPQKFGIIFRYSEDYQHFPQDIYRIPDNTQDKIEQLTYTTEKETADYALVSPTRDSVIFGTAYSPFSVYLLNLKTQEVKDVRDKFGTYVYPDAWSPDQKQFAISSGKEGYLGIMDIDGSNKKDLDLSSLGTSPNVSGVSWLPDGKELVFSRLTNVFKSPIYSATFLYNISKGQLTQLTEYDEDCGSPRLSPLGTQIVVVCRPEFSYQSPYNLQIINLSNPSQRYGVSDLKSCRYSAWSPNGKQVVAVCKRENLGLFLINSDGTGFREIKIKGADNFEYMENPVWSPDGRQIVYVAGDDWKHANIYSVNVDGSNNRPLTSQPGEYSVLSVYSLP